MVSWAKYGFLILDWVGTIHNSIYGPAVIKNLNVGNYYVFYVYMAEDTHVFVLNTVDDECTSASICCFIYILLSLLNWALYSLKIYP